MTNLHPFKILLAWSVALLICPTLYGQDDDARELAELDVAAATLGSIQSWIRTEPEAAKHAFQQYPNLAKYVDSKLQQYSDLSQDGKSGSARHHVNRIQDRVAQLKNGKKSWDYAVPKLHKDQPKQILTELKRQRDAVERYKKSKTPRISSFAYIPKTVWQTKDKLDVLAASGFDTKAMEIEQQKVEAMVRELVKTFDTKELAKKNGSVRDAYKKKDRSKIESFAKAQFANENPDQEIVRIVMPKSSWSNTYSTIVDENSQHATPFEVDRMTVYIATKVDEEVIKLHPMRLMRENYQVYGKLLGKTQPQELQQIDTNEFDFVVLSKNIR